MYTIVAKYAIDQENQLSIIKLRKIVNDSRNSSLIEWDKNFVFIERIKLALILHGNDSSLTLSAYYVQKLWQLFPSKPLLPNLFHRIAELGTQISGIGIWRKI